MYNFFSMQKQEIITIINRALEEEFEISEEKFLPEAYVKSVLWVTPSIGSSSVKVYTFSPCRCAVRSVLFLFILITPYSTIPSKIECIKSFTLLFSLLALALSFL